MMHGQKNIKLCLIIIIIIIIIIIKVLIPETMG